MKMEELMYYNGIGGFSEDGKEYIIRVTNEERTPQPWSHILANKNFGTLLTSNGGGFTWYGNSRENKITSWRNDTTLDEASEKIILQDDYNKWSACSDNILEDESFDVVYGFGYAKYKLNSKRYEQQLDIYITENPYQKVSILKIKNLYNEPQKIDIKFMIHSVLGVAKEYTKKHIVKEFRNNHLKIYNKFNNDYSDYNVYLNIISIGNEQIRQENSNGFDGISIEIELKENEEKEIAFIIDYRKEEFEPKSLIYYKEQYEIEKEKWKEKLEKLQITTPVDSMNIMLNGWIMYQTIVSRILGRASFYQSGGAFGFRDQLQDMLSVLYIDDEMVKNQIIYHAKHQFEEGDVLHWWHPERNNGIRTRFSDDLLWLVYLACEYISFTGNFKFLLEEVNYTDGRLLKEDEQEVYIETKESEKKDELIIHCIKAINKSLDFGEHGLPKMGSGDWNDGMNMVGGESVWLGFFLADILKKFINTIQNEKAKDVIENIKAKIDIKNIIENYETKLLELKKSLDEAWDGRWFKRAYFKTGEALGSNQNDECKIDNISQSWSVISGMATREKQETSMESVENYLADHENMFIKLLTPAFCNTSLEPGYIKSYIPGVRENGGQYTHVCCC